MKAFNDLADFSNEEIAALLELAGRLDRQPEPDALRGKVLSLLFLSPSLRTLASFQAAMTRLGGGSFVISPDMSIHGLETRPGIVMDGAAAEHIREAVPVIASYGDAIGIRAFAERKNLVRHLSHRERHPAVGVVAVERSRHVDVDHIPIAQNATARDPVRHLAVDADAGGAGEVVHRTGS